MSYLNDRQTGRLWEKIKALMPSQTGNRGKFLTTDGSSLSWGTVDALPSQSGQSGKFLTTDGTDASWGEVDALPSQTGQSGKFLTTDGTDASWGDPLIAYKFVYELSINDNVATVLDSSLSAAHFDDVYMGLGFSRDVIFVQNEGYYTIIYELFSIEFDAQSFVFINLDGDTVRVVSVTETNDGLVGTYSTVSGQSKITASGLLKGDGSGNITTAVAGTDYIASHQDISGKLDKSGGTMTGALTLSGAPTLTLHAATKGYVDEAIGSVTSLSFVIVQTLPATGAAGAIYLVPNSGSSPNIYDEYIYVANAWEKIGTTEIDLSGYVQTSRKINNKALNADITLSASDVGALPSTTSIPSKTSDLTNDSGFITGYTETDPTVPAWAKNPTKPTYTATEVGALPIGGGTLTGPLTLNGSPTENLHPATKKYVDDIVGNIETLLASI